MKTILSLLVVLAGSSAFAGYDYTTNMTCRQARHIVQSEGAVVLYTSADIYDRYVSMQSYCATAEYLKPAWIPTRDTNECYVGYTCQTEDHGG
jgi:hypothetical protein